MKTKHSRGPWTAYNYGKDSYGKQISTVSHSDGCDRVCELISVKDNAEETQANARLIAAAPELLAALKMAIGSLLHLKKQSAHLGEDHAEHAADCMAFRAAYEAINKAEGRA
jgi:hypothetical protein